MKTFELTPKKAHPKAKALLTEDFFWSPVEETGPFGSDDGSDAFYSFREWRLKYGEESPVTFLNDLIGNWGYPLFDLTEMTESKISEYISADNQSNDPELLGQLPAMMEQFRKIQEEAGQEFDEEQFMKIMTGQSTGMGRRFLLSQDNAIIAIGFGQFVLEGRINEDIKHLVKIAIKRELLPILIDNWGNYKKTRAKQLNKMLEAVDKMNA